VGYVSTSRTDCYGATVMPYTGTVTGGVTMGVTGVSQGCHRGA